MDVREKTANEMRLIDADALMDVIRQHEYRLATKQGSIDYGMFTLGIQQAVDEQKTIDAVEVVRCKDCKHYLIVDETFCMRRYMCTVNHFSYLENDGDNHFCSYGERKEGAN